MGMWVARESRGFGQEKACDRTMWPLVAVGQTAVSLADDVCLGSWVVDVSRKVAQEGSPLVSGLLQRRLGRCGHLDDDRRQASGSGECVGPRFKSDQQPECEEG